MIWNYVHRAKGFLYFPAITETNTVNLRQSWTQFNILEISSFRPWEMDVWTVRTRPWVRRLVIVFMHGLSSGLWLPLDFDRLYTVFLLEKLIFSSHGYAIPPRWLKRCLAEHSNLETLNRPYYNTLRAICYQLIKQLTRVCPMLS